MHLFRFPMFGVYLLALSSFGSAVVYGQPARAQGLMNEARRSELILTNLPPKGSRAYKELLALAGKDVYGRCSALHNPKCGPCPVHALRA
jgi:hypothetical protein